mmetsp:Transcript_35950/g.58123  ORF Transcript_35950/g.58123 Transcript_35950/m.58123 type:complete len:205 (-) Transcript_35950:412-1026(-)
MVGWYPTVLLHASSTLNCMSGSVQKPTKISSTFGPLPKSKSLEQVAGGSFKRNSPSIVKLPPRITGGRSKNCFGGCSREQAPPDKFKRVGVETSVSCDVGVREGTCVHRGVGVEMKTSVSKGVGLVAKLSVCRGVGVGWITSVSNAVGVTEEICVCSGVGVGMKASVPRGVGVAEEMSIHRGVGVSMNMFVSRGVGVVWRTSVL